MGDVIDIYGLSPLQKGILFHTLYDQDDEHSFSYIVQVGFLLGGQLDVATFEKAWEYVIHRHEVLRSVFVWEEIEKPIQAVYQRVPFTIHQEDWSAHSHEERAKKLQQFLNADRRKGFLLNEAPLMRVTAIKEAKEETRIIWTHHHILLDGWSVSLVFSEVMEVYLKMIRGELLNLPKSLPYKKYIQWINKQDQNQTEEFWKEELKGFYAPTPLAMERNDQGQEKGYGECVYQISEELTENLQEWVRNSRLTLNTLVQGAWAYLISRYSGESDIVFGVTSSGRPTDLMGAENMVGLFINTLPTRIRLTDNTSVVDWLRKIQMKEMERRQYEYSPLVDIHGWSEVPRSSTLFHTLYVFENYPIQGERNAHLRLLEVQSAEQTNYPLTLITVPGKEITLKLMYDRHYFDEETMHRIQGHLSQTLIQMTKNSAAKLSEITYLTPEERAQLLERWNETKVEYPKERVIQDLFEQQVAQVPNSIALVYKEQQLTYRELNEQANQLAHYLQKKGVGTESMVGICVERSIEMIVGILGILKAGGAYVPFDPAYPEQRLHYILRNANIKTMVSQISTKWWLPEDVESICLDEEQYILSQECIANPTINVTPENLAYVIYTSGSTGNPKGVLLEHKGLCNLVHVGMNLLHINQNSRVIQFSSFSFDASVFEIFTSLVSGGTLYMCSQDDIMPIEPLTTFLQKNKITHALLPPAVLNILNELDFKDLKTVISAGAPCNEQLAQRWSKKYVFINGYGPTEASVFTTFGMYDGKGKPPIGRPLPNLEVYVLDKSQQPVSIGEVGELYVGGTGIARGYLNRPELTEASFITHPFAKDSNARLYRSGDLVKYLPDGNIDYIGRIDNQVKIRSFRIELGEIETLLGKHPMITEVAVVVSEDKSGDKRLVAYVAGDGNAQQWRKYAETFLPNYMVPSHFVKLDALPLTINGKVNTKALPKWEHSIQNIKPYMPPRNEIETKLVKIWSKVLGVEESIIGVNDSFFELGGHSLKIMATLVKTLSEGWNVTIKDYYELQTISKIAEKINNESRIYSQSDASKIQFLTPPKKKINKERKSFNPHSELLLTGATGYLGTHLLEQLLDTTKCKVYCLVRGKNDEDAKIRLLEKLKFYFKNKFKHYDALVDNQLFILSGDIAEKNFGLDKKVYENLNKSITTVIHTAALTKHYGDYTEFERANILSVKEILKFVGNNKQLHHVSTTSVSGEFTLGKEEIIFRESDFYINQNYEYNVYIKSKFLAEHEIFKAVSKGTDATIYRVGNLTNRYCDGQHQSNIEDNAFMSKLKFILQYGVVTNKLLSNKIEFTPIDYCSRVITKFITSNKKLENDEDYVFHVYNHQKLDLNNMLNLFNMMGHPITILSDSEYHQLILNLSKDKQKQKDIQRLMVLEGKIDNCYTPVKLDSTRTQKRLELLDFKWPSIDIEYLQKAVDYMVSSDFLILNEK
ncbi:non-ribosomal peptide synthetase [Bacillus toyonensis]|uniref:thioester reductase domain-containing protein n=2 Tax=Bacillus toyonensis TaxID=155322 RepID=UPI0015965DA6